MFVSNHREGIDDDSQDKCKENLENQDDINILEYLEESHCLDLTSIFNKKISYKSSYSLISSNKNKSKAGSKGITISECVFFEIKKHENTEKILNKYKRYQCKHNLYFWSPNR